MIQEEKSGTLSCHNDQTLFTYPEIARSLTARYDGSPCTDRGPNIVCMATQQGGAEVRTDDKSPTLTAAAGMSGNNQPVVCIQNSMLMRDVGGPGGKGYREDGVSYTLDTKGPPMVFENHAQDSRVKGPLDVSPTVSQKWGTGGNNVPLVMETEQAGAEIAGTLCAGAHPGGVTDRVAESNMLIISKIAAVEPPAVVMAKAKAFQNTGRGWWNESDIGATLRTPTGGDSTKANIIRGTEGTVRRLTPLECERLQGFPDGWTDIGTWTDSKGRTHETSDAARYKALGNSIAIPPWAWVLKRLCACYERTATMASLFDGIGGFPLIWERLNGPGSCLWASEIEEFPIAVTKRHFGGSQHSQP